MYCLNMLAIALELARGEPRLRGRGLEVLRALRLHRPRDERHRAARASSSGTRRTASSTTSSTCPTATPCRSKVRSLVGLIPLFAVETLEPREHRAAAAASRGAWSGSSRTGPSCATTSCEQRQPRRASAPAPVARQRRAAARACCATCSTRASSSRPTASARCPGSTATIPTCSGSTAHEHRVDYEPAESTTGLFGGNSNWRGPIWFPINFLLIEALQKFDHFYGDALPGRVPDRLGQADGAVGRRGRAVAAAHAHLPAGRGRPPAGPRRSRGKFQTDPHWRDLILFYEYFHGDTGRRGRRQPPDRLDRARGEAPAAERRVAILSHDPAPRGPARGASRAAR